MAMNDALIVAFQHNAWANGLVLDACQSLNEEQLSLPVPGTYGPILNTLWHIVSAEAGYCGRLSGSEVTWDRRPIEIPPVAEIRRFADDMAERWMQFLERLFEATQTYPMPWPDGTVRDIPAAVPLFQAIHHSTEHRAQIATALTVHGTEPPGWGLWEWVEASGRAPIHRE